MTNSQTKLKQDLAEMLRGGSAHRSFSDATAGLPAKLRGGKPEGQPHTPWRLVEHMRRAQYDILQFILDPDYESPDWPDGYWPDGDAPPNDTAWDKAIADFQTDAQRFIDLVQDAQTDVRSSPPHMDGKTILHEATLAADHNSYHIGQLILLRRLLGAWED